MEYFYTKWRRCGYPVLLFGLLLWFVFALILRLSGTFHPAWVSIAGLVSLVLAIVMIDPDSPASDQPPPHRRIWYLAVGLIAFLYLYSPGKHLAGNWDPGVYLAQGAVAAKNHQWTISDTALSVMGDEDAADIYPFQRNQRVKVPGFYAPGPPFGTLIPQFLPLYPTLLAVAHWIGGMDASLRVDGLFFLFGLLLIADLARRLSGSPWAAWICLVLLGCHPVTVWFARFHTSESLTFLLFSALLWSSYPLRQRGTWLNTLLVAMCALLLPWATMASLPVAISVVAFALVPHLPRLQRTVLGASGLSGAVAMMWFMGFNQHPYGMDIRQIIPGLSAVIYGLIGPALVLFALGLSLLLVAKRTDNLLPIISPHISRSWPWLILTGMITALILSMWLQPRWPPVLNGIMALIPLPWWLGFAAGLMLVVYRFPQGRWWCLWLILITGTVSLFFWRWPLMPVDYPWAWKRWIWILLPVSALFCSVALTSIGQAPHRWGKAISVVTLILLMAAPGYYHRNLLRGNEWSGLKVWVRDLSAALPPDSIIWAPRELATPLEFIYGHTVIPLYGNSHVDRSAIYRRIWDSSGPRPPVVIARDRPAWLPPEVTGREVSRYRGEWTPSQRVPTHFRRQSRGFHVFLWTRDHPDPDASGTTRQENDGGF